MSFTLSWRVPGRDSTAGTVVTDAYSRFCWTGQPVDTGSMTLVVPRDLEVVTQGSAVRSSRKGRERRLTARGDLAVFYACTDVYDPSLLVRRDLVSPLGHAVSVEGLPGHDAWLEMTSQSVTQALAGVEGVVGAPLPGTPHQVRQVPSGAQVTLAIRPSSGVIRWGPKALGGPPVTRALTRVVQHGPSPTTGSGGLAEWTSARPSAPCDQTVATPRRPARTASTGRSSRARRVPSRTSSWCSAVPLAACAIQGQVSAAIGAPRMRAVIGLLLSGDSPYDLVPVQAGDPSPEPSGLPTAPDRDLATSTPPHVPPGGGPPDPTPTALPGTPGPVPSVTPPADGFSATRSSKRRTRPVDWRQWLDIVDEAGLVPAGVTDLTFAEDLLVTTGVIRRRAVRDRADARVAFHELRALGPGGVTPAMVRRGMDHWEFDDALRDMRLATRIANRLTTLPASAERAELWSAYERATSRAALERLRDRLP